MVKIFLMLVLMFSFGTVNAEVNSDEEKEQYDLIILEQDIALGALVTGNTLFIGSMAAGFILDIPDVGVPIMLGGIALGAALSIGGVVGAAIAGAAQLKADGVH